MQAPKQSKTKWNKIETPNNKKEKEQNINKKRKVRERTQEGINITNKKVRKHWETTTQRKEGNEGEHNEQ